MYGYIYRTNFNDGEYYYVGQKKSNIFLGEKYIGSGSKIPEYKEKYPDNIKVELIERVYSNQVELSSREMFWIEEFDAVNDENYLNISSGGFSGYPLAGYSEENKKLVYQKISEALKGEKNHFYGKTHSEETRQKISNANKGNNHMLGKNHSEEIRQKISYANTGRKHSEESKQNMSNAQKGENNAMYGKTHSEETRQKISNANKGKTHSEKSKQKMSEARKGENNHFYGKTHSEETKQKLSKAQKGKIWITKENENKFIYPSELNNYINDGWIKGRFISEEIRQKFSEAQKGELNNFFGKKHSEESKQKMSVAHKGENNAMYGKTHSEESKRKISEANKGKGTTGRIWITKNKESLLVYPIELDNFLQNGWVKGRYVSDETKQKMSESKKGNINNKGKNI